METIQTIEANKARVLVVDDEPALLKVYGRVLGQKFAVRTATDGAVAAQLLEAESFDAIVSDISMPGMDGMELLRAVRSRDLDVPVLLITGGPSVDSAARAVELGAFRYLVKPTDMETLAGAITQAVHFHGLARLRREAQGLLDANGKPIGDLAGLEVRFVSALQKLWMAYQPIVSWRERRVVGYEALLRSDEPAMPHPGAMLDAAERLGWIHQLGRAVRDNIGKTLRSAPRDVKIFVNLHANDLLDEALFSRDALLAEYAESVVLEITERAALDVVKDARARVARLRETGYDIAVDDLGAGYAGLTTFAQIEPEVVKLDMSLIRNVHAEPVKQRLVRSFASLCRDMNLLVIAEGVETVAERDALVECGCDLFQGYLFARPGKGFPGVSW
jgi:EAL domain-containing protein (putative c-di-GMP-specific phosphodiesterase class I)